MPGKERTVLSANVLSIPESFCSAKTYTLTRRIAAIRLTRVAGGHLGKLGDILQLPPEACVECCGDGYNERTVKVRCAGEFYFVFWRDLDDEG